jgi:hypothetical protein
MRVRRLAFGVTVFLTGAAVAPASGGDTSLLIKAGQLTPALVVAVAKVGEERAVDAQKGTDILLVISQYCGTSNARRYYLPLFISANAGNADIAAGRTILTADAQLKLPACLFADEKLVAVPVSSTGVLWGQPMAVNTADLEIKNADSGTSGSGFIQWRRHQPGSGKAIEYGDAAPATVSKLAGQSVDFDRLKPGSPGLPDVLSGAGPNLVADYIDSGRLEDPRLKAQYERLVKQTLSAGQRNSLEDKPNADVEVRISAFERATRTQDILVSNTPVDFTKLPVNAKILTSDFAPGPFAITLKTGMDSTLAANEIRLASLSDPAVEVAEMSDFVPFLGEPQVGGSGECGQAATKPWPYDIGELRRVLELRKRVKRIPRAGKLLVLDTGFPPDRVGTPPFAADYFVKNSRDTGPQPYLWGARPKVYFIDGAPQAGHGVSVLTLALGGVAALKSNMLMNLVERENGQVVSFMGYKKAKDNVNLDIDSEAVGPTLFGTTWGQQEMAGINLSLRFNVSAYNHVDQFSAYFKDNSQVLYVFAAGNSKTPGELEFLNDRPATWGGREATNIITVGGLAPDNTYWSESNYSTQFVDIAAPACGVPTFVWNTAARQFEEARLNGTSFAAPLVSFTANLLRNNAFRAARAKARIVGSGRYIESLKDKVGSSRALDVPVAVATNFDVVRMREGTLRLGMLNWPETGKTFCKQERKRDDFMQIHRADEEGNRISVILRDQSRLAFPPPCPRVGSELTDMTFQDAIADGDGAKLGEKVPLDFRDVLSITLCDDCVWR